MNLYLQNQHFDELLTNTGRPRRVAAGVVSWLRRQSPEAMQHYHGAAELAVKQMGISFAVYSEDGNLDRAWPFDIIPRLISNKEWQQVKLGLEQRSKALNQFINDIYNDKRILREGIIPPDLVLSSPNYQPESENVVPKHGAWAHICGTDLVRDHRGQFRVLEDNLRVPSGVSYMIENRELSKRIVPELFENHSVLPVDDYPSHLYKMLVSISNSERKRPCIVVLTPGTFNSAYFEHAYLAKEMGVELVEGSDLFVADDDYVYMNTVEGEIKVDVVYRRVGEEFLDPEVFRKDSTIGVPGIMRAWKKGNVAIANAPGAGVADDKAIYAFVPQMIRYYLKEEPLVQGVKTYLCREAEDLAYVQDNIEHLVIKPVNESGGYGLLVGPHSTPSERARFSKLIKDHPENYVGQPTLSLSTAPTLIGDLVAPRHLDLRPFTLSGGDTWVSAGGLTRVALKEGSLVVNSSQGGGSKDTWIVETEV